MSDTEAVREVRDWRRQVHEELEKLTPAQRAEREENLVREAIKAGLRVITKEATGRSRKAS